MDESMQKNISEALLVFAKSTENITKKIDVESMANVFAQCAELLNNSAHIKVSDSLAETLSMLSKMTEPLSELQKIAITKELAPSCLVLSDMQRKMRNSITKEEAAILAESSDVDVDGSTFKYKDEVISKSKIKEAIRTTQLFDDVSLDEILEFSSFLYQFPYLAVSNVVGKKIYDECANIDEKEITLIGKDLVLYRARVMKNEDEPFSEQEMRRAPFKIPGQGRFNTQGVARFYLSGDKDDAVSEVIKHAQKAKKVQIAKYKASATLKLLDMSQIKNAWSEKCLRRVPNPGPFNSEYLCGGFLAQCIDYYKKIDGIMYGTEGQYLYMFFDDSRFTDIGMEYVDI